MSAGAHVLVASTDFVLRFFTGDGEYSAETIASAHVDGKECPPFVQQQCEKFNIGRWDEDGRGGLLWSWTNKFETTIHAINSCVIKLSKLTKASNVSSTPTFTL